MKATTPALRCQRIVSRRWVGSRFVTDYCGEPAAFVETGTDRPLCRSCTAAVAHAVSGVGVGRFVPIGEGQ